jgi:hypothetical protein
MKTEGMPLFFYRRDSCFSTLSGGEVPCIYEFLFCIESGESWKPNMSWVTSPKGHESEGSRVRRVISPKGYQSEGSRVRRVISPKGYQSEESPVEVRRVTSAKERIFYVDMYNNYMPAR